MYYSSHVAQNYGELFPMHIAFSVTTVLSQGLFKDNLRLRHNFSEIVRHSWII